MDFYLNIKGGQYFPQKYLYLKLDFKFGKINVITDYNYSGKGSYAPLTALITGNTPKD